MNASPGGRNRNLVTLNTNGSQIAERRAAGAATARCGPAHLARVVSGGGTRRVALLQAAGTYHEAGPHRRPGDAARAQLRDAQRLGGAPAGAVRRVKLLH